MAKQDASNKDIYIKNEGNKLSGVIFLTKKSKDVAKRNNVPNHYEGIGDQYRLDILPNQASQILKWAISHDLSVDSEINITI